MGKTSDNGVALLDYRSVPTSIETSTTESKPGKKYTVNKPPGSCVLSRIGLCLLMAGILLLLTAAVLITYFLVPGCTGTGVQPMEEANKYVVDVDNAPGELREDGGRLGKEVWPVKYKIKIQPFIWVGNFTTDGEVIITLNITESTNKVTVNINDIDIHEDSVKVYVTDDESSQIISVVEHKYDKKLQTYTMILDDYLKKGTLYDVRIGYTGHLNDLLQGFYRINYIDYERKKMPWIAATQFSPTDARRAFPCLDEPAFKAKFSISLARWKNMTTRSNMEIQRTDIIEGSIDWVWDHYHETPVMSTYLVGMIVSDLLPLHISTESSRTKSNVNFSVWSRPEALEQTRFAGSIGPRILEYFEKYFQIPYPLPKMDMVALPDFGFSAMENWGLITFRESALLFDEKVSTIQSKRQIVTVMSHELGHQWFGNLVTPEWWDDLWLKEGFATYTEYLGAHHVQPDWDMLDEFVTNAIHSSFEVDCLESSHPIYIPVQHTEQIRQIFDPISYKKGASIIRMLNYVLGEYTFKVGLINYLNAKKYANAYHDDLWDSLTKQAHIDGTLDKNVTLKEIMDTWIMQTGYPVLNVSRNYNDNTVTISQERFYLASNASKQQTWWVPVSYTTQKDFNFQNTTPKVWMQNEPEITLSVNLTDREYIHVNIRHGGYYRVNYDVNNWKLLTMSLLNFPHVTRSQLIDDAMFLARANQLDYDIPFSLAIHAFRNTKYTSMSTVLRNMKYIDNMLATTSAYGKFKLFMSQLTEGVYNALGFTEGPDESYDTKNRRIEVLKWACTFENSDCTIQARQMFRDWMVDEVDKKSNPKRTVPPNLKPVVYCTAIREGGEAEWDFAFTVYTNTNSGTEKEVLLNALGCASEGWLLSRYLERMASNSSGIRKQDGALIFKSVTQNVVGHKLAFDFLRNNWKQLNDHYGLAFSTISKMVSALPVFMNSQYELAQLVAFKNDNINNLGTAERAFDQSIEATRINVEWMSHSYKRVEAWLDDTLRKYRLHSYNFS